MSRFIGGEDRTLATLLPEHLDDYIAEDNPVRVVDAFVDELDLKRLGFAGADPAATGEVGQGTIDRHQCAGKHCVLVRSEWKFNVATDAQDHVGAVDGGDIHTQAIVLPKHPGCCRA